MRRVLLSTMMLCCLASTAIADGAVPTAEASVDAGWNLIEAYGWIWGSMAILFGGLAAFLKRNESQKWIAKGRVLAILIAISGVGASVVEAGVAGTAWAGIVYTAILAVFKVVDPRVLTGKTATSKPASGPTGVAAVLAVLVIGLAVAPQVGCSKVRPIAANAVGAFLDCEQESLKSAWSELVPLASQTVLHMISPDGRTIDTAPLRTAASSIKSDVGRCAIAAAFAALMTPPRRDPDAPASEALEVSPAIVRAAFEELRPALGGTTFAVSGKVL